MGAPVAHPEPVEQAMAAALGERRPFVVFSDGDDLLCIFGGAGDSVADVQGMASRSMPWGS